MLSKKTSIPVFGALFGCALLLGPAAFGQVTKVPVFEAGLGGGGAAGSGAAIGGSGITSGGGGLTLSAPTLNGTNLPSSLVPSAVGQTGKPLLNPVTLNGPSRIAGGVGHGVEVRTAEGKSAGSGITEEGTVPKIGSQATQQNLKTIKSNSSAISQTVSGREQGPGGGEKISSLGATVFDGAGKASAFGTQEDLGAGVDASATQARGPPQVAADDPLGIFELLNAGKSTDLLPQMSKSPTAYKNILNNVLGRLKNWQQSPRSGKAKSKGGVTALARAQTDYKNNLYQAAEKVARDKGLDGRRVITNGTSLSSLMGILFSGGIEATNPYPGFSGERAHIWGAYGLEGGGSYGAKRGVGRNEPGVLIMIHNEKNPIKVVEGETLSRAPQAKEDFLAVIITDGDRTVVLDAETLAAISASSALWKEAAVRSAHSGSMRDFLVWEKFRDRLEPDSNR